MALLPPKDPGRQIPGFPGLLWDILRAGRGRPEDVVFRQLARLRRLIEFARSRSPYYRERYAALPRDAHDLPAIPPVSKADLMTNFDRWATDPAVTRDRLARTVRMRHITAPAVLAKRPRGLAPMAFATIWTSLSM